MDTKISSLIPGCNIVPFLQFVNMYTCMNTHIHGSHRCTSFHVYMYILGIIKTH